MTAIAAHSGIMSPGHFKSGAPRSSMFQRGVSGPRATRSVGTFEKTLAGAAATALAVPVRRCCFRRDARPKSLSLSLTT